MLTEFLRENQSAILALTEKKTRELAGDHPSSPELERGLPIFYRQVIDVIRQARSPGSPPARDLHAIARAADRDDEPAMAEAAGQPLEAELARSAGLHGSEMLRLGYTLSHVVHAYGAMCQSITEVASKSKLAIEASEFHALNRCLDVAIAGAVSLYQSGKDSEDPSPEGQGRLDLAKEMQGALLRAKTAFHAIQTGKVGASGSTAGQLARALHRLEELIDQSLLEWDPLRAAEDSS